MKLVYAGVAKENLKNGINIATMSATARARAIKNIFSKKSSNMLGWLDLPLGGGVDLEKINSLGSYISKKFTNFVVLGIGGSALGIKMLQNIFVDSLHIDSKPKVEVCDNIDPDSFVTMLDKINLKKTSFNIITKSGTTSETLSQMLMVIARYKRKKIDYTKHLVITTTKGNDLWKWAEANNIDCLDIPTSVGGRFSVLSAVGLLPAKVMGLDISALLNGAKKSGENSCLNDTNNIAYTTAYINYMMLKKGCDELVMMPYSDRLKLVPEFFAQLWAESLGKRLDREGNEIFAGQTPIKSLGVTDQHSQLQLYTEGPFNKVINFITVEKSNYDDTITESVPFASHLTGTTMKTLLDYEYESTAFALTSSNRPNYTISLDCINEESIGELIFYMEMMTAFMGEMLNVDAYDQPGVELSKIYTKACLKVKGYTDKEKEIKNYAKLKKNYTLN